MQTTATTIANTIAAITETATGTPNPAHGYHDPAKVNALAEDMAARGWQGPPIVVDGEWALTGSHRIAAHVLLVTEHGIEVPIPRVEIAEVCQAYGLSWAELRADAESWGGDMYDAGREVADLLPRDVVDYLGLDLH